MDFDRIHIEDLTVFANHGVLPEETKLGQKFLLSLTLYLPAGTAGARDELDDSVDYGAVCAFATAYTKEHPRKTIEAASEDLAAALLDQWPKLAGVGLTLKKPWAPVGLPLETVSFQITRRWHTAYIALGSNLGDKKGYLDGAVAALGRVRGCRVEQVSPYLVTAPYGGVEQDDFLNACLSLRTWLTPQALLDVLHRIEQDAHRERTVRWGPRTLDLDLLLYDDAVFETSDLVVPHVEMHKRTFVLEPLRQIAPNVRHPILKKTIDELARDLEEYL